MREIKKISFNKIYLAFLVLSTMFMCIAYASVNLVTLNIEGKAVAKEQEGVFITDISINNNVNVDLINTKVNSAFQTTLNSVIYLSLNDPESSITYDITVYNKSNNIYTFTGDIIDDSFYSNSNIVYKIINLSEGDTIKPNEYLTFQVKFYYLDKNNITNNVLSSLINFNFEYNTWTSISGSGYSDFKIINSKENDFININATNKGGVYEKINIPLNNLEVGSLYQLTFTTWNDGNVITTDKKGLFMYGCTVVSKANTNYTSEKYIIGYSGMNSGYLWKTLSVAEQTATLTFKATASTMYWVWDLSLISDSNMNLYIKDVSIKKSTKPQGAYVNVPSTTIYQDEYVASGSSATVNIQKGTYITKADYDDLVVKVQTAGAYEFINIPIVNLTVGKKYTVSFSNLTTNATKNSLRYGAKVQANKQEDSSNQLITSSDYNITNISIVNNGSITFTATASTMYLVWDLGGLADYRWSDIRIYNISLKQSG